MDTLFFSESLGPTTLVNYEWFGAQCTATEPCLEFQVCHLSRLFLDDPYAKGLLCLLAYSLCFYGLLCAKQSFVTVRLLRCSGSISHSLCSSATAPRGQRFENLSALSLDLRTHLDFSISIRVCEESLSLSERMEKVQESQSLETSWFGHAL